jgi:hypothetical protein
MAVKMKPVGTYRFKAARPTCARAEIPVRGLTVMCDKPLERGGAGAGPRRSHLRHLVSGAWN